MKTAFGITAEDVQSVLAKNTILVSTNAVSPATFAALMLQQINLAEVAKAAMFGNGLEEQTEYAHDCIEEQLLTFGIITINGPVEVAP